MSKSFFIAMNSQEQIEKLLAGEMGRSIDSQIMKILLDERRINKTKKILQNIKELKNKKHNDK